MTPLPSTPDFLTAPNGFPVRITAGGAVFSDLGPAMGRTTSFPHRLLANVPNFRNLVERRMVGKREGYILPADGVAQLLKVLDGAGSKTEENEAALKAFLKWAGEELIPKLRARFGEAQPRPGRIRISAGGVDLRLELADLSLIQVEVELLGRPRATLQGNALLQAAMV